MEKKFKDGRPKVLEGHTFLMRTGCGKLYITVNSDDDGHPAEVMARMGKTGGCVASQIEGLARLISTSLQSGVETSVLVKQLRGIRCPSPNEPMNGELKVTSCSDAFAQALDEFVNGGSTTQPDETMVCKQCGGKLVKDKQILRCDSCGLERSD